LKITMLVNGHTTQEYELEQGKSYLKVLSKTNLIVDDELTQLAKIESLTNTSNVTVIPRVMGG
jgi:hypothetical protein